MARIRAIVKIKYPKEKTKLYGFSSMKKAKNFYRYEKDHTHRYGGKINLRKRV